MVISIASVGSGTVRSDEGREAYPVAFSNMPRAPSVIFSFVPRCCSGFTFPPPTFFSAKSRPGGRRGGGVVMGWGLDGVGWWGRGR